MSLAVQAALFAAGVTVGAIAVSASTSSAKTTPAPDSTRRDIPPLTNASQPTSASYSALAPSSLPVFPTLPPASDLPVTALKYGLPGPIADVLKRRAYVAGYDRQKRHPAWTAEHLTAADLRKPSVNSNDVTPLPAGAADSSASAYARALIAQQEQRQQIPVGDRSNSTFREDVDIPAPFRATLEDYFRSGYDRGHMVPAADAKRSQEAMDETFLLSNIAPQVGDGFNRHYWAYVEDFCRRLTGPFADVYVFTVPLYLPKRDPDGKWRVTYEVIGAQGSNVPSVAVPTHFAKVVLGSKPTNPSQPLLQETSIGAFVLPNAPIPDETPFETFKVPVDAVERAAGLTLFDSHLKAASKDLCRQVKCDVIVRRFDDTVKKQGKRRNSTS